MRVRRIAERRGATTIGEDTSDERYVRVATGLDYRDAAPISGIRIGDAQESMLVTVHVQR